MTTTNEEVILTPSPKALADYLRSLDIAEDDVLDLIKRVGDAGGWTKQLNEVGLHYLKPDAPEGEAVAA